MNVTKQMEAAIANWDEFITPPPKTAKIFEDIMAGVVEETMPFAPIIDLMDCGGWRADWFVKEPAISVRLIVSAAEGQKPIIFWEIGKEHGVEIADPWTLNSYVKWLAKNAPTPSA